MTRDFEAIVHYLAQQRQDTEYTDRKEGLTSRASASAPGYEADPSQGAPVGMINVRLDGGRVSTVCIIGSEMRGFDRIPNLRVKTGINKGQRICIKPADDLEALIALANSLSAAGVQNQYIQGDKFTPGLVTADAVSGYPLGVYVQAFTYGDQEIQGAVAITAPAVADTRRMSVIYYDVSADALGVVYGTASALPAAAWMRQDALSVALGDTDRIRLGAVLVQNGQTSITTSDRFFDVRDWFSLRGISAADVSYTPTAPLTETNVQDALDEAAALIGAVNGSRQLIYDNTLATDTVWTVTDADLIGAAVFADFRHVYGRATFLGTDNAGSGADNIALYVGNGSVDSTNANYRRVRLLSTDTGVSGNAADQPLINSCAPQATAFGNGFFGNLEFTLYDINSGAQKLMHSNSYARTDATVMVQEQDTAWWENTAVINQLQLQILTSGNFKAGGRLELWGEV